MPSTKTSGNPEITHGDDDEWVAATLTRIDSALAGLEARLDHQDSLVHEIRQAVQPLIDHPEALGRAVKMLDRELPAWMGGRKRKD